jgi:hypothetical protein
MKMLRMSKILPRLLEEAGETGGEGSADDPGMFRTPSDAEAEDLFGTMATMDNEAPVDESPAPADPAVADPFATPEAPAPAPEDPKPADPVPAPVPAEPVPPVQPAPDPLAVAQPETPPQPAAPGFDPVEFEKQYVEKLTESYQLTDAEQEAWDENPIAALPVLAANLHKRVVTEALAIVQAALPAQIERYQEGTRRETEAKERFYSKWPDLRPYEKQVLQAGQMYAKMAPPNATPEQRIEAIGRMVASALGLPSVTAPVATPATAAPQAPAQPYVPSGGGSSGGHVAPQNVFSELTDVNLD